MPYFWSGLQTKTIPMPWHSLRDFIQALERSGELVRIRERVSPALEITEIADRMIKSGGPALLFEDTGTAFPLLINAMGSDRRIAMALNRASVEDFDAEMQALLQALMPKGSGWGGRWRALMQLRGIASWLPVERQGRGACQEVVMPLPDLSKLPVLTCWPHDGGPFITLPLVHTQDPDSGERNLGMYRMQVFSPRETGMHWHRHKHGAAHFRAWAARGQRMPVAVALGGDPAYTYAATAPLPDHIDEYILAGFLRRRKVELVKCLHSDLRVPADADFILEGYVDPAEDLRTEGPFGDHTGFYSLEDQYPVFHLTAITHRRNAVFPATIVGIPPQEDNWIGKATERLFLMPMKTTLVPELTDISMPKEGVFHNVAVVSIRKAFPGQAAKVMNALWGAGQMMFNKVLVVVDEGVDVHDPHAVMRAISAHVFPSRDLHSSRGPLDVLDHASRVPAMGGKLGIDATAKLPEEALEAAPPEDFEGSINLGKVKAADQGITGLWSGEALGYPVLVIALHKTARRQVRKLAEKLEGAGRLLPFRFLIITEHLVDPADASDVLWRVTGNLDVSRDCYVITDQDPRGVLVVDGTSKYHRLDGFSRPWPNIIAMDPATIAQVDTRWPAYDLGPFVPSPSLKYLERTYPGKAVAEEGWAGKIQVMDLEEDGDD